MKSVNYSRYKSRKMGSSKNPSGHSFEYGLKPHMIRMGYDKKKDLKEIEAQGLSLKTSKENPKGDDFKQTGYFEKKEEKPMPISQMKDQNARIREIDNKIAFLRASDSLSYIEKSGRIDKLADEKKKIFAEKKEEKRELKVGDMHQGLLITKINGNELTGIANNGSIQTIKWVDDHYETIHEKSQHKGDKIIKKFGVFDSSKVDEAQATEMKLEIDDDGEFYHQRLSPIYKNLDREQKKGVYDSNLAQKQFEKNVVDAWLKNPKNRESMGGLPSKDTRIKVATEMREDYEQYYKEGIRQKELSK